MYVVKKAGLLLLLVGDSHIRTMDTQPTQPIGRDQLRSAVSQGFENAATRYRDDKKAKAKFSFEATLYDTQHENYSTYYFPMTLKVVQQLIALWEAGHYAHLSLDLIKEQVQQAFDGVQDDIFSEKNDFFKFHQKITTEEKNNLKHYFKAVNIWVKELIIQALIRLLQPEKDITPVSASLESITQENEERGKAIPEFSNPYYQQSSSGENQPSPIPTLQSTVKRIKESAMFDVVRRAILAAARIQGETIDLQEKKEAQKSYFSFLQYTAPHTSQSTKVQFKETIEKNIEYIVVSFEHVLYRCIQEISNNEIDALKDCIKKVIEEYFKMIEPEQESWWFSTKEWLYQRMGFASLDKNFKIEFKQFDHDLLKITFLNALLHEAGYLPGGFDRFKPSLETYKAENESVL